MPLSSPFLNSMGSVLFTDAADIDNYFRKTGGEDFISWFNARAAGQGFWVRGTDRVPLSIAADSITRNRFNQLWSNESIQTIFGAGTMTLLQFIALQSIILNEAGARLFPGSEGVGHPGHPGIAYAFDHIPELKASYNVYPGNMTCYELFNDAHYNKAFGTQPLAVKLKNTTDHTIWGGQTYPQQTVPTATSPDITGYVLEADFFKFRGRGFIQTTGRSNYIKLIAYVRKYAGSNTVLTSAKTKWNLLSNDTDVLATTSTNEEWDALFQDSNYVMAGIAIASHNGGFSHPYLQALTEANETDLIQSVKNMGRCISGSIHYAHTFENRVLQILELLQAHMYQ